MTGWMVRNRCLDDGDPDRFRCSFYSFSFDKVGMAPGVILLCVVAGIATWTSYMVGVFKIKHRGVYGIDEAGGLMFGKVGREVFGIAFCLCE